MLRSWELHRLAAEFFSPWRRLNTYLIGDDRIDFARDIKRFRCWQAWAVIARETVRPVNLRVLARRRRTTSFKAIAIFVVSHSVTKATGGWAWVWWTFIPTPTIVARVTNFVSFRAIWRRTTYLRLTLARLAVSLRCAEVAGSWTGLVWTSCFISLWAGNAFVLADAVCIDHPRTVWNFFTNCWTVVCLLRARRSEKKRNEDWNY